MRVLAPFAVAAALTLAACGSPASQSPSAGPSAADPSGPATAGSPLTSAALPSHPGRAQAAGFAAQIARADATIADPRSAPSAVRVAGEFEQFAVRTLANAGAAVRREVTSALSGRAAAVTGANLDAASSLGTLTAAEPALPTDWRIVPPLAPRELLRTYRAAGRRTGVGWEYLAAINFVETKFGRVVGPSTTGAQGPMQFMPATWGQYGGRGNVHDPHAAIPAAARMLAAVGAPGDMPRALRAYNDSASYVRAVTAYARVMRRWPREFLGYWNWQVLYRQRAGTYLLPVGYPNVAATKLPRP